MNKQLIVKIVESIGYSIGPALIALNIVDFRYARHSHFYYFTSATQWGIAIGVLLIGLAYVARKWRS